MPDATITTLVPRTGPSPAAPRDCGVARVISLPDAPTGRIIQPLARPASARPEGVGRSTGRRIEAPGPLARALMALDPR